jgi:pimeloyl-ACP methyl ester carboxylesterase
MSYGRLTKRSALAIAIATFAAVLVPAPASADQLVVVTSTRTTTGGMPVTVRTLVRQPQFKPPIILPIVPRGVVVLLPGADGWLDIDAANPANATPQRLDGNFVVRTREGLSGQGFLTVLVDAPSDLPTGMTALFRTSDDHARDLTAVISHFKPTMVGGTVRIGGVIYGADAINSPVVVVGSSNGTISAVLAALKHLPPPPILVLGGGNRDVTGVVLTSSVTSGAPNINSLPLPAIVQPVLFVHHVNDGCVAAKYRDATDAAFVMMKASVRVNFAEIAGVLPVPSDPPSGPPFENPDPCAPPGTMGYTTHGLNGAGTAALDAIQRFILGLKH